MRPVAAWLALKRETIFDDIVAIDPAVVLDHGDPQALSLPHRIKALEFNVARYGSGGWRGLSTPQIQVHRFASPELADCVNRLYDDNLENPEVRHLLLRIIGAGKLSASADTAYGVAMDRHRSLRERDYAIEALLQLGDPRLEEIAHSIETDTALWPEAVTCSAMISLFPAYMPIPRLVKVLARVKEAPRTIGELNYQLPRRNPNVSTCRRTTSINCAGLFLTCSSTGQRGTETNSLILERIDPTSWRRISLRATNNAF